MLVWYLSTIGASIYTPDLMLDCLYIRQLSYLLCTLLHLSIRHNNYLLLGGKLM